MNYRHLYSIYFQINKYSFYLVVCFVIRMKPHEVAVLHFTFIKELLLYYVRVILSSLLKADSEPLILKVILFLFHTILFFLNAQITDTC